MKRVSNQSMAIGIDVGGTKIRAARISADGEIVDHLRVSSGRDPELVLSRIMEMVNKLDTPQVSAIGVGIPGRVDMRNRKALSAGYVDFSRMDPAEQLEKAAAKPVTIDNDANMALVAEAAIGAGKDHKNIVMFTIGTGIGGGILNDGQIVRGNRVAGQLGHIIVEPGGLLCACGGRGCVETKSSGTALGRHIAEAGLDKETSAEDLIIQCNDGDPIAKNILTSWARPLRQAIGSSIALLDPEIVVLGGGLGHEACKALDHIPDMSPWFQCPVVPAKLGDDAGVIGAALSALSQVEHLSQTPIAHKTAETAKRVVLVNGIPATGKSSVAKQISDRLGWTVLSLDAVKNPFLQRLPDVDREFNRLLGRASYEAIFAVIAEAPAGTCFIVDAWFGFQPKHVLKEYLKSAGVAETVEVWCHAPGDVLAQRYNDRSDQRPKGHPGVAYIPELIELAKRAEPLGLSPLHEVDTTLPIDFDAVVRWIRETMTIGAGS